MKGYNSRFRDELVILLPGVAILVFVSSQTGFSIHSRYVIPALPFFFIWTSKVGRSFDTNVQKLNPRSTIYIRIMCIVFSIWSIGSSIVIYPYSISYFNELAAVLPTPEDVNYPKPMETPRSFWCQAKYIPNAGPRNGPRHLLDSNIDWGQDLFRLERWCKKHPEIRKIKVAYWRSYPLDLTKIPLNGPPPENNPQPGWYAVSVNHIYDREKRYRYFLYFEPYATIGYSIYIYHITLKQVNDAYSHK